MSYQERKARLARLFKGTMWESEHPEEKRIPEQVRSVSREVCETAKRYFRKLDVFDCESDLEHVLPLVRELHSCPESVTCGELLVGELILALWLAGEGCFLVHGSYVLLDAVMGYRSQRRRWSFKVSLWFRNRWRMVLCLK